MSKNKDIIQSVSMKDLRKKDNVTLQQETVQLVRASNVSLVEVGKRLIVLKEKSLKKGEYQDFIKNTLKLDNNIATKYVRIVKKYGLYDDDTNMELVTTLGVKKAIKLLVIADLDERLSYIKENNLTEKTYKELEEMLNKDYLTEVKPLNGYSLYTNVHRSLQTNLKALVDNKDILKDKEIKTEAQEIEKELQILIARIENLKSRLGKTEEAPEQEAK